MTLLKDNTFYWPFPVFGIPVNEQWFRIRTDTELLKAIVDSVYYENTDGIRGHASFAGMDFGEQGFNNHYRIVYEAATNTLRAQCNEGTTNTPNWVDIFHLDCDGQFDFVVDGSLSVEGDINLVGDFYGASVEVSLEDGTRSLLTTERVIHLNPNNFYLTRDSQGEPVVNISGGGTQVIFTDEARTFIDNIIHFNPNDFYLSGTSQGEPVLNALASGGGAPSPTQWFIRDGVRNYLVDDVLHVNQEQFYLDLNSDGNPRLNVNSPVVELSDVRSTYRNNNININKDQFYLTATANGEPVINFNTAEVLGAAAAITFTDGTTTVLDNFVKFMPDDFYLSLATDGSPIVNAKPRITVKGKGRTSYDDTLIFNNDHFYITTASTGDPIVNLGFEPITIPQKFAQYFATQTTITNGTAAVAINMGNKIEDVGGWFNPIEPTRLTVPPGIFRVQIRYRANLTAGGTAPGTTAYFDVTVNKNGAAMNPSTLVRTVPANVLNIGTAFEYSSVPLKVVPGDYFEILVATTNYAANGNFAQTAWFGVWEINY